MLFVQFVVPESPRRSRVKFIWILSEVNLSTETRDNVLRAVRFEGPTAIPMVFHINEASWYHYPEDALKELMAAHPILRLAFRSGF